jgi:hypothetical protein
MSKFTFKTTYPEGKYRAFSSSYHEIKLDKKVVGTITDDHLPRVKLMVMKSNVELSSNPNCKWEWVTLKGNHETIQHAKDFVNKHIDAILDKFELHKQD